MSQKHKRTAIIELFLILYTLIMNANCISTSNIWNESGFNIRIRLRITIINNVHSLQLSPMHISGLKT